MPKNDNIKGIRLYESVKANIGEKEADKMAEKLSLSKSADYNRKYKWACDVCAYLEENYNEEQIVKIRTDCSCTPPPALIDKLRRLLKKSGDYASFAEEYESSGGGAFTMTYTDGAFTTTYPRCYCACVSRVSGNVPKTWCLCTLGYTKKLFDAVLDADIRVELLESVKTGGEKCVIVINV